MAQGAAGSAGGATSGAATATTGPASPPTGPTSPPPNNAPPPTSALPAAPTADLSANANWYTFSDRTIPNSAPPVLLSPPPPGSVVPPEGQPPALVPFRAGLQAREVTGGGEVLWGVGFGFDFADSVSLANMVLAQGGQAPFNECDAGLTYDLKTQPVPVSVDASAHAGISFWGRSGLGSQVVRVQFPDRDTDPWGGVCNTCAAVGTTSCDDDFGESVTFTPTWQPFMIRWSALATADWSGRHLTTFDASTLYAVRFYLLTGAAASLPQFDVLVADVQFVDP